MNQTVETVTASLFREYLHRNNLKVTLEALDREVPRDVASISNRLELAKTLHILKLIKANKHRENPYISMAEMIVADLIAKTSLKTSDVRCIAEKRHTGEVNCDSLVVRGTLSLTKSHNDRPKYGINITKQDGLYSGFTAKERHSNNMPASKVRASRHHHFNSVGKLNSSPPTDSEPLSIIGSGQKNPSLKTIRPPSRRQSSSAEFETAGTEESAQSSSNVIDHFPTKRNNALNTTGPETKFDCMEFIDIENEIDDELEKLDVSNIVKHREQHRSVCRDDLTIKQAISIREIVFGNATRNSFNPEWEQQSFIFNDLPYLEFGLIQHKGGPCGILAVVQAMIVKHLLSTDRPNLSPSNAQRQSVLVKVLAHILWRAAHYTGSRKQVYICTASGRSTFHSSLLYRNDGVTEKLQVTRCETLSSTEKCIKEFLPQFQSTLGKGCILLLYSAILSRGVDVIKLDMDEPGTALMANHGYCSQELVNLLMMGYAAQNVFNNTIDLDGKILKGVCEPQEIGFLTLYEYYKVFEVGSFLKDPSSGVWVICSESHYSVLFSSVSDRANTQCVPQLIYYDSLGNQKAPYKLTVYPESGVQSSDDDPPIDLCIRTRWPNAKIDWNGDEPLL